MDGQVCEITEAEYGHYKELLREKNALERVRDRSSLSVPIITGILVLGIGMMYTPLGLLGAGLTAYIVYDTKKAREEYPLVAGRLHEVEEEVGRYQIRLDI